MINFLINKFQILAFLCNHPLTAKHRFKTFIQFIRWQIGSRLVPGVVAVNFVNKTRLLVETGMTGATGSIYAGLHEFEDMSFVLHLLRKEDVFLDIGANIGSYTIIASGAVGAKSISIEPIPSTFEHLLDNINLNNIREKVSVLNIGLGSENGILRFTSDFDTINHVITKTDVGVNTINVQVKILDEILSNIEPQLIKIDVEGFETNIIKGATKVLSNSSLMAVIMELNGSGERYGFDENELHQIMLGYGFKNYRYLPFERRLVLLNEKAQRSGNSLYIRDIDKVKVRLTNSNKYNICNVNIAI